MLRLNLAAEPHWLELLPGVRLHLRPCTSTILATARSSQAVQDLVDQDASEAALSVALAKEVAALAVIEWEGVGGDDGESIAVTREATDAALEVYPLFEAFQVKYMAVALLKEQEKNVSAPSRNGISAGAMDTVKPARKPAKPVPTGSTSRKR